MGVDTDRHTLPTSVGSATNDDGSQPAVGRVAQEGESAVESPSIESADGRLTTDDARDAASAVASAAPIPGSALSLLATVESLSDAPLFSDCDVQLLTDGPETYQVMLDAIRSATRTVHLETYILADDKIGQLFARELLRCSAAGIEVRVIFDSFGSRESDESFFEKLRDGGVAVVEYHEINPADGGNVLDLNNRTHRKILTVDGRVAFTGGINLSHHYSLSSNIRKSKDPESAGWRDTHVKIVGPAVSAIEAVFDAHWGGVPNESLEAALGNKVDHSESDDLVAVLQFDGGKDEESSIYLAYLKALELAEERIWLTQGYFAPDKRFEKRLIRAARRGVDVRLLVPGFSDTNVVVHASRSRYGKLLKRGIRIYEYNDTVLHAKTAVIDGYWSTVGSSNLDSRSRIHNDEINAVILGNHFGRQMEEQFLTDIETADAVSFSAWQDRPKSDRAKEFVSGVMEYWL